MTLLQLRHLCIPHIMAVNIKKPIGLTTNIATTSIVDDMIIVAMIIATYMDVVSNLWITAVQGKIVLYHRRRSHVHASAWLSSTHVECNSDQAVKESVANMENVSTVYLVKTGWHPL
ncbi:conserved domain protein [Trichinella spiralis]|uniref:Uncharacterized protein n=1 Tax=Trichinella spiralis TaxID=6334 RepID=E5S1T6_TRISP|nr:conserved domain protein [Trichinella spiralis]KRY37534.1 hypothetical protein T01_4129 [Trichinella spiralis]